MPLPLQRVASGQPLAIPARDWNAMLAAVRWVQQQQRALGGGPFGAPTPNPVIVRVKNAADEDIPAGGILGIGEPIFPPPGDTLSANTMLQIDLRGVAPTDDHKGAFVVTLEPIRKNAVGRAVVGGVCWVKVQNGGEEAEDEEVPEFKRAEANGSTTALAASADGSAHILWRQSGRGEKWAIVRLGAKPMPRIQLVALQQTSGSRGGPTSAASWVYTATDRVTDFQLGTNLAPLVRVWPFAADAASYGLIEVADDGTVTLIEAFEPQTRGAC